MAKISCTRYPVFIRILLIDSVTCSTHLLITLMALHGPTTAVDDPPVLNHGAKERKTMHNRRELVVPVVIEALPSVSLNVVIGMER